MIQKLEKKLYNDLSEHYKKQESSHDLNHILRVLKIAKKLCIEEEGIYEVVLPAVWFHDYINLKKNDSNRHLASKKSAEVATQYLKNIEYSNDLIFKVANAVEAHSFSANKTCHSLEAMIVQDADRLDALGSIGIIRCFTIGSQLGRFFYHPEDPFAKNRNLDDFQFTLDHFYNKLFKIKDKLNTETAKTMAEEKLQVMNHFIDQLQKEIEF